MWKLEVTAKYDTTRKWFEKKRIRELKAVDRNLATYFAALALANPLQIKYGFIHPEPLGVVAIELRERKLVQDDPINQKGDEEEPKNDSA